MNTTETEKTFALNLPLPDKSIKYYEIIYVPYNETNKALNIKKYGFKLSSGATLKDYKSEFEKVADIRLDTKYLLM